MYCLNMHEKENHSVAAERQKKFSKDIQRRSTEALGVLAWIRDRFAKFGEVPEETMKYCETIDPEYRKQIQELYVATLNEAIFLLHLLEDKKCHLEESRG